MAAEECKSGARPFIFVRMRKARLAESPAPAGRRGRSKRRPYKRQRRTADSSHRSQKARERVRNDIETKTKTAEFGRKREALPYKNEVRSYFFGCEELNENEPMMTCASSLLSRANTTSGSDTITRPFV